MLAAVTVSGMKTRPVMKKGCRPVSRVSRVTFLENRTAHSALLCEGGRHGRRFLALGHQNVDLDQM